MAIKDDKERYSVQQPRLPSDDVFSRISNKAATIEDASDEIKAGSGLTATESGTVRNTETERKAAFIIPFVLIRTTLEK